MGERFERDALSATGLTAPDAERLGAALAAGGERDLGTQDLLLRAGVLAARDPVLLRRALPALLAVLEDHALDPLGRGIRLHLGGLVRWRLEGDVPGAARALAASLAALEPEGDAPARRYLPRVLDTWGQMLQHEGLLEDARAELERALALKRAASDAAGAALTEGNLGRLCMELGDFEAAAAHLETDRAYVQAADPGNARLRSQLGTQLGACLTETGELAAATQALEQSLALATAAGDAVGAAFATVHRGRLALVAGDVLGAGRHATAAREALAAVPEGLAAELAGVLAQLEGEVCLARGDPGGALPRFEAAAAHYGGAARVSPVERAEFLEVHARALAEQGRSREAAERLRLALRVLDRTSAEALRRRLDARLRALDETAWLLHGTGRFVGHEALLHLLTEAGEAGFRGHQAEVVVLFSDLRDFTGVAERLAPEVLVALLNRYLGQVTRSIERFGGMVDKFIGDAVMAVFSLPAPRADDADRALAAALHMQVELERFNRTRPADLPALAAGVGLHGGRVVAGLIGSPQRQSYTVIGDAVNTASRLEGLTKILGVPLLASATVVDRLCGRDRFRLLPLGAFRPKGRRASVEVHAVLGERDDPGHDRGAGLAERCAEALARRTRRDFAGARAAFEALEDAARGRPEARAFGFLAAGAALLQHAPPPADWDGAIELKEK